MRIYTYVIVNDAGWAPNYDAPLFTLAICKPRIRAAAEVGDLVLAFTGKPLGPEPHAVQWAGILSEKLTFADYWRDKRFQSKKPGKSKAPDNIYRPKAGGLAQVPNTSHNGGNIARDLSTDSVLLFKRAWYFGEARAILPASFGVRMATDSRRGHRISNLTPKAAERLIRWLDTEAPTWEPAARSRRPAAKSCKTSC